MNGLLSIITINYNNSAGLSKTIDSVRSQTYRNIQYIIIDGGSSDDSVEVIKKNVEGVNYWVSERDLGVYNAQNKGILQAEGQYLLFLNSGDYLASDNTIADIFDQKFEEDIVYGDVYFDTGSQDLLLKTYPSTLTFDFFYTYSESLPHPSTLIKKTLFDTVGLYREEFKVVSDWEFWLKAIFLHQATYKRIPVIVSVFNMNGISSQKEYANLTLSEMEIVYKTYFSGIVEDYRRFNLFNKQIRANIFVRALKKVGLLTLD